VIVDCAVYQDGIRRPEPLAIADAFEAGRAPDSFVWIGMFEPTEEEFAAVRDELALHALAVEDAVRAHQRPKLDVYDDTVFLVLRTARYDDANETIVFGEIHVFTGDGFVVTIRHGEGTGLGAARRELEGNPARLACGPGSVLHAVCDRVVDEYQKVIEGIENDIDEVEAEVFSGGRGNAAPRIFKLMRLALQFNRAVLPSEEPLEQLAREQVPSIATHPLLAAYFRDVLDHTIRLVGRIDTARQTLSAALDANLAVVTVRQNDDMRAMSGWAAVIAVPTLLAGIWGMNFSHMPELDSVLGYPLALLSIGGSAVLVRWRLRKNGWF
jgi:magnesium transporter